MSDLLPTISELEQLYLDVAQSTSPAEIDITQLSDFQAKAAGAGALGARLALDAYTLFNAVYPQNGNSFGVNTQLSSLGVPSQYPASVTTLTTTANDIPAGKTYTILVGTVLIAPNSQTYEVISPDGVSTSISISSSYSTLYLTSAIGGSDTSQDIGAIIKFSPPQQPDDGSLNPVLSVTVTSAINGTDEETLSNAVNRLISVKQTPRNGSSVTDFKTLVINPAIGVTDAVVLTNNQIAYTDSTNNANVAIFDAGGSTITDDILNKGLAANTTAIVFNRSVSSAIYNASLQTVLSQDVCGWQPVANTVSTQAITTNASPTPPFIKVIVTLAQGASLNTNIFVNNGTFTIYQIIQREVRRAICGQPFGAALTTDLLNGSIISSTLPTSAIEQQLDIALGTPTTNGILGNYLISRSVLLYNGTTYQYQPNITLQLGIPTSINDPIQWVYDISLDPANIYYNIVVTTS